MLEASKRRQIAEPVKSSVEPPALNGMDGITSSWALR
jgi:hypothetical protein